MNLSKEVLRGAGRLALEIYGENNKENRRKVYHKFESGHFKDAVWKEGGELVSTRNGLRDHYRASTEAA